MCRWMAWRGQDVLLDEVLFKSQHGIVDQALHARMGAEPTNGDGFGVGWYDGTREVPGVYRNVSPAWSDPNLRELAAHVSSPLFLAHVRAAIGSPVQQTNCHPFRHGRWLFVHNGYLGGLHQVRRELVLAVEPDLFADIEGTTDTEIVFALARTLGLEQDPIAALERTVGLVEAVARRHGIPDAVQGTFGVSDGATVWAVRYATTGEPRTLFVSADVETIQSLYPDRERFRLMTAEDRLVVSEPFADLPGVWHPVEPSTALTVGAGGVLTKRPFVPQPWPADAAEPAAAGLAHG